MNYYIARNEQGPFISLNPDLTVKPAPEKGLEVLVDPDKLNALAILYSLGLDAPFGEGDTVYIVELQKDEGYDSAFLQRYLWRPCPDQQACKAMLEPTGPGVPGEVDLRMDAMSEEEFLHFKPLA